MGGEQLAELLARQARRWAIEGREGMPLARGAVVAIAAAEGAEATAATVAARVAAWLDYGLFDAETLAEIARDPALCERFVGAGHDASGGSARVLATLGERGMAVLVGPLPPAALPPARTLHVLVFGSETPARAHPALDLGGCDLALNLARLPVDAAATLVVEALRRRVP